MSKAKFLSKGISILSILTASFIMFSCAEKLEAQKSMEQIRKEDGIAVKVKLVQEEAFEKDLSFFSTLRGYEESTKGSLVSDRVLKMKAKVGQSVSAGQVLVEFPSNNPALGYMQAKASLENAKKMYDRMNELLKAGETSQQNVDNLYTQYEVSRRNVEAIEQLINIEAPISGIITEVHKKEGDHANPGDPLFTVAKLNKMIAKVWASEREVLELKTGMPATVTMGGKEFKGTVNLIPLAMDDKTRAFGVEILLDNPRRDLKSGVTVDVRIKTYTNPRTIVIPRNLVFNDGGKHYVYLDNNGQAARREVTLGMESGIDVEVTGGLSVGERLITEGQTLVSEGTKIKVIQ